MKTSTSRLRASLFVAVLLWAGGARALSPAQGMELLLTDLGARGLVGYGLLFGDALTVRLSVQEASMQAVVAFADGEVRLLHGELLDDRLWLYQEDEGWLDLAAVLASAEVALRLLYDGGREVVVAPWAGALPPGIGPGPPSAPWDDADDDDDGDDRDDAGEDRDDGGDGGDDGDDGDGGDGRDDGDPGDDRDEDRDDGDDSDDRDDGDDVGDGDDDDADEADEADEVDEADDDDDDDEADDDGADDADDDDDV
jgi:hypothetical protein